MPSKLSYGHDHGRKRNFAMRSSTGNKRMARCFGTACAPTFRAAGGVVFELAVNACARVLGRAAAPRYGGGNGARTHT